MKPTIKELQKENEAKGQLIMDKNTELYNQRDKIKELNQMVEAKELNEKCLDERIKAHEDFFKTLEKIINGKSKPVSKIEVLRDLINPQQRIHYNDTTNLSSI